jgi:2-haloacid dehalogenase
MCRYRTILLDADNTLFDFTRAEHDALMDTLRFAGITPSEDLVPVYSAINEEMWKRLERGEMDKETLREARFAAFAAHCGFQVDVPAMAAAYTDYLSQKTFLIDGALEVCQRLAEDCRLYIVTNGLKFVQDRRFAASPLQPLFKNVFISEEIGFEKPAVQFFDAVRSRIEDFSAVDTLVVGDSLTSDIKGGINAGLDTCWFNPKGKPAPAELQITHVISRLEALLPIVLGA